MEIVHLDTEVKTSPSLYITPTNSSREHRGPLRCFQPHLLALKLDIFLGASTCGVKVVAIHQAVIGLRRQVLSQHRAITSQGQRKHENINWCSIFHMASVSLPYLGSACLSLALVPTPLLFGASANAADSGLIRFWAHGQLTLQKNFKGVWALQPGFVLSLCDALWASLCQLRLHLSSNPQYLLSMAWRGFLFVHFRSLRADSPAR